MRLEPGTGGKFRAVRTRARLADVGPASGAILAFAMRRWLGGRWSSWPRARRRARCVYTVVRDRPRVFPPDRRRGPGRSRRPAVPGPRGLQRRDRASARLDGRAPQARHDLPRARRARRRAEGPAPRVGARPDRDRCRSSCSATPTSPSSASIAPPSATQRSSRSTIGSPRVWYKLGLARYRAGAAGAGARAAAARRRARSIAGRGASAARALRCATGPDARRAHGPRDGGAAGARR